MEEPVNLQLVDGVLHAYFDEDFNLVTPELAVLRKDINLKTEEVVFTLLKEHSV